MIYDIGSLKGKPRLRQIVNRYFINKKFDLAFISHFHEDHVNGFEELKLKKNNVYIERLVVPYVSPLELALLSVSSENAWYKDFITNPYLWLLKNLNVKYLYIWGGGSGETPSYPPTESPLEEFPLDLGNKELLKEKIKEDERKEKSIFQDL